MKLNRYNEGVCLQNMNFYATYPLIYKGGVLLIDN